MNKHRVKAFTILEITITMLITALLIGIAYTSYTIIIKSYSSFNIKNEDMAALTTLDHLLKRDFEQADTILKWEQGIILKKDSVTVKYIFDPDFIVRNAARTDTFKVKALELNILFENIPITGMQPVQEENRVDELFFSISFQNQKIPYHYRKLYSSENLIQRKPDALD